MRDAMDLSTLKEHLPEEAFAALSAHISDLTGQRDAARNESINGRKGKQATIDKQAARIAALEDYIGIDAEADLTELPPIKQQLDASKQADAKLKRAERERDEAKEAQRLSDEKLRGTMQRAALSEAIGGHEFVAKDIVETYVSQRMTWEGEELLFKTDDGKLVSVKDGIAGLAASRPELLKPAGTGGAGVRHANAGSGGQKLMHTAEFNALPPKEQAKRMADGYTLTD
jgi:hypothetical protein